MSDTPRERRIYETAARDEDAFLVDYLNEILARMDRLLGWHRKYDRPGRPRNTSRRGPKQTFTWKPMPSSCA